MKLARFISTALSLALILSSASVCAQEKTMKRAHSQRGCSGKKRPVLNAVERCLRDIRGTVSITDLQTEGGAVVGATLARTLGNGFEVSNVVVTQIDITSTILATGGTVNSAAQFELQFDVTFDCPCQGAPTVTAALENSAGSLFVPNVAYLNSTVTSINNVTPNGFTANVFFIVSGVNAAAVNGFLAGILNPATARPSLNIIAQCSDVIS